MDIYNPSGKTPALAVFIFISVISSWFQLSGHFYKLRVLRNLTFTTFLSPFINTVLSFSNTMWILSVAR